MRAPKFLRSIRHTYGALNASIASTVRSWKGSSGSRKTTQPAQLLELYDIENSPYCRIVREALTTLDIDVMIYPCPSGTVNGQTSPFRATAEQLGGKQLFPFLVDPNTGSTLYESADIVNYLYSTYSHRAGPSKAELSNRWNHASGLIASGLRVNAHGIPGLKYHGSKPVDKPLELFSFESSPFSKPVRETLCELAIPYILRQFGKSSSADIGPPWMREKFHADKPITGRNRLRMHALTGRMQVPYLIDPNSNISLFESNKIVRYLQQTYGV